MTRRDDRGFALVIVLVSIGLLALLGTHLTLAGRTELRIARNVRNAAVAEAIADGAIHQAAFHLLDGSERKWRPDGQVRRLAAPDAVVDVQVMDARGLVNPNSAPPALMAALLRVLGTPESQAIAIAAALFDWRTPGLVASPNGAKAPQYAAAGRPYAPPGRPFADLDEIGAVMGMTPALLAALRPHLSLYNYGEIDPARAGPAVRRAIELSRSGQPGEDDAGEVVVVRARAALASGTMFQRDATLMLRPAADGRPFRILTWESGS